MNKELRDVLTVALPVGFAAFSTGALAGLLLDRSLQPSPPQTAITFAADSAGQFRLPAAVGTYNFSYLYDSGSAYVAFSMEDARKIGLKPEQMKFNITLSTANGKTLGAEFKMTSMQIGLCVFTDVQAVVLSNYQGDPLLGMTLLRHAHSDIHNDRLTIDCDGLPTHPTPGYPGYRIMDSKP